MIKKVPRVEQYRTEVTRKRVVKDDVHYCDLCNKEMDGPWLTMDDDCGNSHYLPMDLCEDCFDKKVIPWLKSQKKKASSSHATQDN